MKRRYLLLLIPVVLAAVLYCCWPSYPPISSKNAARIRTGMTRVEVEAILGPPREEMSQGQGVHIHFAHVEFAHNPTVTELTWTSDEAYVWLGLDKQGVVLWKYAVPVRGDSETRWQAFLWRVKAAVGVN
jgi:hypothetical protein